MADYASWAQQQAPKTNNFMGLMGYGQPSSMPLGSGAFALDDYLSVNPNAAPPGSALSIPMAGAAQIPGFSPSDPMSLWGSMQQGFNDSGFLQQRNADGTTSGGWGTAGLGVLQGLGSAYMGMKQYGLAKDAFAENKRQFGLNYDAQRTTTNSALEDRQRARVASNAGAYESVGNYMDRNGIK